MCSPSGKDCGRDTQAILFGHKVTFQLDGLPLLELVIVQKANDLPCARSADVLRVVDNTALLYFNEQDLTG